LGVGGWVLGFGFGVWGLGFEVWSLGCGVWGVGCELWGLRVGFRTSLKVSTHVPSPERTLPNSSDSNRGTVLMRNSSDSDTGWGSDEFDRLDEHPLLRADTC